MPGDIEEPLSSRQMPSSFDENHDFFNERPVAKIWRKLKEEPLVPLGTALTVTAFVSAWRATRRGDSMTANKMFRARVAAQAFTIVAMVAGGMYYNKDRQVTKEIRKLQEEKTSEEKRQKWIAELEARDEEEKALKNMMAHRKAKADEARAAAAALSPDAPAQNDAAQANSSGGGVLGALGLSGWGKSAEKQQPEPEQEQEQAQQDKKTDQSAAVFQKIKPPVKPKASPEESPKN